MTDLSTAGGGTREGAAVVLPFTAGRAAAGPLTWAQSVMWGPLLWFGKEANQFNLTRSLDLPAPLPQPQVLAALRLLIERYETLRTHYVLRDGTPRQEVSAEGTYELTAVPDGGDPARTAAELTARLAEDAFDHQAEWPLRVGLAVDADGLVGALALVGSHLAFDGWAYNMFADQLADALAGRAAPADDDLLQPLEQALFQASDAGREQGRIGLKHWADGLATAPASMFDLPRSPTGPLPVERHLLDSRAVTAAATALAARTRTSFSTVLLGLTALVLTAYNGHDSCVLKLIVGNRLDRRSRDMIALNTLNALLVYEVDRDVDVLTAIRRMHRTAFDAYRRAQCDPQAADAVVERVGRERGVSLDLTSYFNNGHRGSDWAAGDPDLDPAVLPALREQTGYSQLDPISKSDMKFMIAASSLGGDVCRLGLLADTAYLPGATPETMLRGLETLLCDLVAGEVRVGEVAERIGLTPAVRDGGWVRIPSGWVRPDEIAELVREAAGGAESAVLAGPPGSGGLTAYVAGAGLPVEGLHQRVLELLAGRTGVAAPVEYVLCAAAPPAGADPVSWRDVPVVARGTGVPR